MKIAALDLGSNTFLMLIARVVDGKIEEVYGDYSRVTRLSQGVDEKKEITAEAMTRARDCFDEYMKIATEHKVDKVVAVATSAARDAKNGDEFIKLAAQFNIPVSIISGDKEAELTFVGSTFDQEDVETCLVLDIGGGSTEMISKDVKGFCGHSLNIGSVRLTEKFISNDPPAEDELNKMTDFISEELNRYKDKLPGKSVEKIVAVAGTPTTLSAILQGTEFEESLIHKSVLNIRDLEEWKTKLSELTNEERLRLPGMQPGREDVIIAGLSILIHSAKFFYCEKINVSTKGVRYGLALKSGDF